MHAEKQPRPIFVVGRKTDLRSFFGSREDVEAIYQRVESSADYANWMRPGAEEQRLKDWINRPRRKRQPSLSTVKARAARAGIEVAGYVVSRDGTTIIPGTPQAIVPEVSRHYVVADAPDIADDFADNNWTVL